MTSPTSRIAQVEVFYVRVRQPAAAHNGQSLVANQQGYIIDPDNGTIYPADDRTLILKVTCENGTVGWGETYGIVAAGVVRELVNDVIGPFLCGKDPLDVQIIWQNLYNMMRVRGYTTGFWLDALAGIDIALWDLCGKLLNVPVYKLLGGRARIGVPAYATQIRGSSVAERLDSATQLYTQGYRAFKVHAASSFDAVELIGLMRERYPEIDIMLDLHWCFTAAEAIAIARRIEPYRVAFLEAPCRTEDVDGLARVAAATVIPIAVGEEWRTVYDAHRRLQTGAVAVVQPEMGRTGITQFMRICQLAELYHARIAPHATIGFGVFMAASLHAASTVESLSLHEAQNEFVRKHLHHFETNMRCEAGQYVVPDGIGLGITPKPSLFSHVET